MITNERAAYAFAALMVGYVIVETIIKERHATAERFTKWRNGWLAPFLRTPGRREFLRESLIREEMREKEPVNDAGD
jgi:molybdopterin biosynthesis enzyme